MQGLESSNLCLIISSDNDVSNIDQNKSKRCTSGTNEQGIVSFRLMVLGYSDGIGEFRKPIVLSLFESIQGLV